MECLLTPLKSLASVGKSAYENFGGACHVVQYDPPICMSSIFF